MTCSRISGPKAVFKPEAGEEGRFVGGGLPIEVELGGPPGADAIFQFDVPWLRTVGAVGLAEGGFALDFEIAWLFEVMGIGDEVGFFLGPQGWQEAKVKKGQLRVRIEGLQGGLFKSAARAGPSRITTDLVVFSRLKR